MLDSSINESYFDVRNPLQTHYAIITSLLRQNDVILDVITLKPRRFDVKTALLLRYVFSGLRANHVETPSSDYR